MNCVTERAGYGEEKMRLCTDRIKLLRNENKKLTYHLECYKDATNLGELKRSKERYERTGTPICLNRLVKTCALLGVQKKLRQNLCVFPFYHSIKTHALSFISYAIDDDLAGSLPTWPAFNSLISAKPTFTTCQTC